MHVCLELVPKISADADLQSVRAISPGGPSPIEDSTIVHWGGEIGRLPVSEGDLNEQAGRDHNGQGFSIWLAGGGFRGGMIYGETDEVGHRAAVNVVTPNDFQATILHLLGIDHAKLVYHSNGREQRLTDARPARIEQEMLA